MIVRMLQHISGGRPDGTQWPPALVDFEVPDDEGAHLVRGGNAVFVRNSAPPPPPPEVPVPVSEPAHTAAGPPAVPVRAAAGAQTAAAASPAAGEPAQPPEPRDHHAAPAQAAGEPAGPAAEPSAAAAGSPAAAPAPAAPKQAWIDFAVSRGDDADKAAAMTKVDLMSKHGGRL